MKKLFKLLNQLFCDHDGECFWNFDIEYKCKNCGKILSK